jgi:hypothetical protein
MRQRAFDPRALPGCGRFWYAWLKRDNRGTSVPREETPHARTPARFLLDHTHFEAAGANQIAAVVATAVRNQGIALSAYLK